MSQGNEGNYNPLGVRSSKHEIVGVDINNLARAFCMWDQSIWQHLLSFENCFASLTKYKYTTSTPPLSYNKRIIAHSNSYQEVEIAVRQEYILMMANINNHHCQLRRKEFLCTTKNESYTQVVEWHHFKLQEMLHVYLSIHCKVGNKAVEPQKN